MLRKIVLSLFLLSIVVTGFSQEVTKTEKENIYTTTSGELIFSFANINNNGSEDGSNLRFSPVFNFQNWVNFDKSDHFGWFTGFSIRNVGFIEDVPDSDIKMKYRTYNLGIPIGVKIGNLEGNFMFVGYELEFPFNYKEKTFIDGDKEDKHSVWFTDRVNTFNHSIMAGVQLPYGATLKFKYYLTNFFNQDYKESDSNGDTYKPFENKDVNVFYFSLSFGLLKNSEFYYKDDLK